MADVGITRLAQLQSELTTLEYRAQMAYRGAIALLQGVSRTNLVGYDTLFARSILLSLSNEVFETLADSLDAVGHHVIAVDGRPVDFVGLIQVEQYQSCTHAALGVLELLGLLLPKPKESADKFIWVPRGCNKDEFDIWWLDVRQSFCEVDSNSLWTRYMEMCEAVPREIRMAKKHLDLSVIASPQIVSGNREEPSSRPRAQSGSSEGKDLSTRVEIDPELNAPINRDSESKTQNTDELNLLLQRLGRDRLDELLSSQTVVEQQHPEELALRIWLRDDSVKDKFGRWWHQKINEAKQWRIEVSPVWDLLASLFDRLFPGLCNTYNMLDPRPHITEEVLYPYLNSRHGLSNKEINELKLVDLAQLLQQDLAKKSREDPAIDGPHPPNVFCWKGSRVELGKTEWKCLEFLWAQPQRQATTDAVSIAVWQDEEKQNGALRSLLSRVNKKFLEAEIPIEVNRKSGFTMLTIHD